jgi:ubiquinone biosynthesis protein
MTTPATRSQRRRIREILGTVLRHALGYLVGVLHLERVIPFHHGLLGYAPRGEPYTRPEHVRLCLEDLGATFIKLGQILSTRADLLPSAYQAEFAKLQDAAPPEPAGVIRDVLAAELGRGPEDVFATFDSEPLAAASIGQAHGARLPDGTEVVVKVRRPGVVRQVEEDLAILERAVAFLARHWEPARRYDFTDVAREFAATLRSELDYLRECANAKRFAEHFARDASIRIPKVYGEETTSRVLTLERIRGIKIDDLVALDAAGIDRTAIAQRAVGATLKMVFADGFFHADPHPGNLFVQDDGRVALIDFGMVGTIDERTRAQLMVVLMAVAGQSTEHLVDALIDLGVSGRVADRPALERDVQVLVAEHLGRSLGDVALGPLLNDLLGVARRHRLRLPATLALLAKTIAMGEAIAAHLDPSFRMAYALVRYLRGVGTVAVSPEPLAPVSGQPDVATRPGGGDGLTG